MPVESLTPHLIHMRTRLQWLDNQFIRYDLEGERYLEDGGRILREIEALEHSLGASREEPREPAFFPSPQRQCGAPGRVVRRHWPAGQPDAAAVIICAQPLFHRHQST